MIPRMVLAHAIFATLSGEKFIMNPLLSPLNVQTWATCLAHACNWPFLRALVSPSLRIHRRHHWDVHWRRCRHHPDNNTPTHKCDLEDEHPIPKNQMFRSASTVTVTSTVTSVERHLQNVLQKIWVEARVQTFVPTLAAQ